MKKKDFLYWLLFVISLLTVVSGAVQVIVPGFILSNLSAESTESTRHFFGIVGMFMVLFGGGMVHALASAKHHPVLLLWAGFQKFGAFAAVTLGVMRGLFSWLALGVAGFDFFSGVLIMWYLLSIRSEV